MGKAVCPLYTLCFVNPNGSTVGTIDLATRREFIERTIAKYIDARLEIVDEIAQWCADNSGGCSPEKFDNPIGKALWGSDSEPNRILLRRILTEKNIQSHLDAIYLRGFENVEEVITNSDEFLLHLVLHEVAHIKNNWHQNRESDCDRWAFDKLHVVKDKT